MLFLKKAGSRREWGNIRSMRPDSPSPVLVEQFLWGGRPCGSGHGASTGPAKGHPWFFLSVFFIKSFSSMVHRRGNRLRKSFGPMLHIWSLDFLVILLYLLALWINLRYRLYEKTVPSCHPHRIRRAEPRAHSLVPGGYSFRKITA